MAPRRWEHVVGIAVSVLVALVAAKSGQFGVIAAAAACVVLVTRADPIVVAGLGLLALLFPFTPGTISFGPFDAPAIQKLLVLASMAPAALTYGVDRRRLAPVAAFGVMFGITLVGGALVPGLGGFRSFAAFVGLSVPWLILAVRWPRESWRLAVVVAWLPLADVAVAMLTDPDRLYRQEFSGVARLQGNLIPAHMASLALMGVLASMVWWRWNRRRIALVLAGVNLILLFMTVTRIAAAAAAVLVAALVLAEVRGRRRSSLLPAWVALGAMIALPLAIIQVGPQLQSRNNTERSADSGESIDTFGRLDAWSQFAAEAGRRPWTGLGLGASTAINERGSGTLTITHNEFLRLYVDGGVLGVLLGAGAIALAVTDAVRRAPPRMRLLVRAAAFAFVAMAMFHNPLAGLQFAVPFTLLLGIAGAPPRETAESGRHVERVGVSQ